MEVKIFELLLGLAGGLGLFLYGMKLMGEGLENAAGDKLKNILERVTSNPISAVLVGTLVTAVIQSSSATTVMVVGFVNAGLMNLVQAAGIIIGANIGTTITAQLVAFKLDEVAPLFVAIGTAIIFFAKSQKRKEIGNIVLGFGILFMGMGIMGTTMKPLSSLPQFHNAVIAIGNNWALGILTGLIMTGIVQSSSATTGIMVAMAGSGQIGLNVAIPVIFGCNIGTCVTALLASIGTSKTAHKAALIHLIFNIFGTIIFIPLIQPLIYFVQILSPDNIKRQIANAHTIFNMINAIIMLPLIKYLIKIVNVLIKGEDEKEKLGAMYIDSRLLETPIIAAGQVVKETVRMAQKAKANLLISMEAFETNDETLVNKVYENESIINLLNEEITNYLVRLSKRELPDKEYGIIASTYHIVNDIERIGDHAENLADLTLEKISKKLDYTEEAKNEIKVMFNYTINALDIAIESYESNDVAKAESIFAVERRIDACEDEYKDNHIKRLNEGLCNAYNGAVFMDILSNFERIGDHSTNIAEAVIKNS